MDPTLFTLQKRKFLLGAIVVLTMMSGCEKVRAPGADPKPVKSPPVVMETTPRKDTDTDIDEETPVPNSEMSRDAFRKIVEDAQKKAAEKEAARPKETPTETTTITPVGRKPIEPPKTKPIDPATTPTEPPKTNPPKTEPPKTNPPKTAPPTTEPKKTEPPKAEPKKSPPPVEPKKEAPPPPAPAPAVTDDDTGVDADDEQAAEDYAGPKTVVDRPRSTPDFQLSEVAAQLGALDKTTYGQHQKDILSTTEKACNFFLITALVEARVTDEDHLPLYMAALFDTKYFEPKGWKQITVETMKQWFQDGKTFDVAIQKGASKGKTHGHVAIPIGLNDQGQVMVAEGVYHSQSNRIVTYSDVSLAKKFRIFARY